jgi:hypothetical protein
MCPVAFRSVEAFHGVGRLRNPLPAWRWKARRRPGEEVALLQVESVGDQGVAFFASLDTFTNDEDPEIEIDAATHRKRLSRARERLTTWMRAHCGLADGANPCRCTRQIAAQLID